MSDENEVTDTRPTSQVDLEQRLKADHKVSGSATSDPSKVDAPYATETTDTSAYVGVSPEYMTHANDTEKPYGFEGVEGESVKAMTENTFGVAAPKPDKKSEQTLGGGSQGESVVTATSGEDLSSKVLKPEAGKSETKAPQKAIVTPAAKTGNTQ